MIVSPLVLHSSINPLFRAVFRSTFKSARIAPTTPQPVNKSVYRAVPIVFAEPLNPCQFILSLICEIKTLDRRQIILVG